MAKIGGIGVHKELQDGVSELQQVSNAITSNATRNYIKYKAP